MYCMKCGREIPDHEYFCPECLEEMTHYPIKPGTVVQLPIQPKAPPVKKPARRRGIRAPEEQVKQLRKKLRFYRIVLALLAGLIVALSILAYPTVQDEVSEFLPGQNYHSDESEENDSPV